MRGDSARDLIPLKEGGTNVLRTDQATLEIGRTTPTSTATVHLPANFQVDLVVTDVANARVFVSGYTPWPEKNLQIVRFDVVDLSASPVPLVLPATFNRDTPLRWSANMVCVGGQLFVNDENGEIFRVKNA